MPLHSSPWRALGRSGGSELSPAATSSPTLARSLRRPPTPRFSTACFWDTVGAAKGSRAMQGQWWRSVRVQSAVLWATAHCAWCWDALSGGQMVKGMLGGEGRRQGEGNQDSRPASAASKLPQPKPNPSKAGQTGQGPFQRPFHIRGLGRQALTLGWSRMAAVQDPDGRDRLLSDPSSLLIASW